MFKCRDLFHLPSMSDLKCIAGKEGLDFAIRWAYVSETVSIRNWVRGGELLIISGAIINNENFSLENVIKEAIELKLSGALILLGPDYIEKIDDAILEIADKAKFSLFTIPWNVPLVDILEDIGHSIVESNREEQSDNEVLSSLLFHENIESEFVIQDRFQEINNNDVHYIMAVQCHYNDMKEAVDSTIIYRIREEIKHILDNKKMSSMSRGYGNNIVVMVSKDNIETEEKRTIGMSILNMIEKYYPNMTCNIGVGRCYEDIYIMKDSFHQALRCIKAAIKNNKNEKITFWKDLGFYGLLYDIQNKDKLQEYSNEILSKIIEYDNKNKTNLLETLQYYFDNNCSFKHGAEKMYIHRNTFKYRIDKIEKLTGLDLEDCSVRLNLHSALVIRRFLQ